VVSRYTRPFKQSHLLMQNIKNPGYDFKTTSWQACFCLR
jgi:hypothetical protein